MIRNHTRIRKRDSPRKSLAWRMALAVLFPDDVRKCVNDNDNNDNNNHYY